MGRQRVVDGDRDAVFGADGDGTIDDGLKRQVPAAVLQNLHAVDPLYFNTTHAHSTRNTLAREFIPRRMRQQTIRS